MRRVFVDTSAWDAIADSGDPNHEMAMLLKDEIAGHCRLVITNYILDELYTLLLMNIGYQRTVDFRHKLDVLVQEGVLQIKGKRPNVLTFKRFNVPERSYERYCYPRRELRESVPTF